MTGPIDHVQPDDHVVLSTLGDDLVDRLAVASRLHNVIITVSVVPYEGHDEEDEE